MAKKVLGVLALFAMLAYAIESGVIGREAGGWFMVIYLLMAALFITDQVKIMILGFVFASTAMLFVVFSYAGLYGIITQTSGLIFFIMWTIIGALVVEFVFIDKSGYFEKSRLYRNYLLLDIAQVFTLMLSMGIMVMAPKLKYLPGGPDNKLMIDIFAVVMLLFLVSLAILFASFFTAFRGKGFMEDFSRAFYLENEKTVASSEEKAQFLRTFKRIRMVTYLLFVASLISIFLVARSKILDAYMDMAYGQNRLANLMIYFIREVKIPPFFSQAAKIVFFVFDLVLLTRFIELLTGKKAKALLKTVPEKMDKMMRETEKQVMRQAMERYCAGEHAVGAGQLCAGCRDLLEYSYERIDSCAEKPFKPLCTACAKRCFSPEKWKILKDVYIYRDVG